MDWRFHTDIKNHKYFNSHAPRLLKNLDVDCQIEKAYGCQIRTFHFDLDTALLRKLEGMLLRITAALMNLQLLKCIRVDSPCGASSMHKEKIPNGFQMSMERDSQWLWTEK